MNGFKKCNACFFGENFVFVRLRCRFKIETLGLKYLVTPRYKAEFVY